MYNGRPTQQTGSKVAGEKSAWDMMLGSIIFARGLKSNERASAAFDKNVLLL